MSSHQVGKFSLIQLIFFTIIEGIETNLQKKENQFTGEAPPEYLDFVTD